jgi:hypothetical protein
VFPQIRDDEKKAIDRIIDLGFWAKISTLKGGRYFRTAKTSALQTSCK